MQNLINDDDAELSDAPIDFELKDTDQPQWPVQDTPRDRTQDDLPTADDTDDRFFDGLVNALGITLLAALLATVVYFWIPS